MLLILTLRLVIASVREAIQSLSLMDCHVAYAPRNDETFRISYSFFTASNTAKT